MVEKENRKFIVEGADQGKQRVNLELISATMNVATEIRELHKDDEKAGEKIAGNLINLTIKNEGKKKVKGPINKERRKHKLVN
ncbi:MAG: hypothetical protein WCX20_02810 [Candidatus Shapirobacteria bacterium]|jgi:translation elongation factor EF-1alpha